MYMLITLHYITLHHMTCKYLCICYFWVGRTYLYDWTAPTECRRPRQGCNWTRWEYPESTRNMIFSPRIAQMVVDTRVLLYIDMCVLEYMYSIFYTNVSTKTYMHILRTLCRHKDNVHICSNMFKYVHIIVYAYAFVLCLTCMHITIHKAYTSAQASLKYVAKRNSLRDFFLQRISDF